MMEHILAAHLDSESDAQAELLIVGAGGGQELLTLGTRGNWSLTGVDPSEAMLELARQRLERVQLNAAISLTQGTVQDLDHSKRYAAATCILVLHFLQEPAQKQQLLEEVYDRLQDGGILIAAALCGDINRIPGSLQMKAWSYHMHAGGITEQECEWFQNSIGNTSFPVPEHTFQDLLHSSGFTGAVRFFSSYLIEGWFAVKPGKEAAE
ncbi:SAM-dependent methyltransferase [Paenibacillus sp. PK3_47]|uniref:class I SAM-dependent methyltransferase n=1 Tax=Paenibacillus sp. PK3_47 TaxID=2072642 RepID=UPI00201D48E7|nr:class I SAM-dependent methyltransferase [Paenibacillus sp. PK3_47]UQZ36175.1 SAM-dependent methyltransferase [Paenibacillus sp. PK3_47]